MGSSSLVLVASTAQQDGHFQTEEAEVSLPCVERRAR